MLWLRVHVACYEEHRFLQAEYHSVNDPSWSSYFPLTYFTTRITAEISFWFWTCLPQLPLPILAILSSYNCLKHCSEYINLNIHNKQNGPTHRLCKEFCYMCEFLFSWSTDNQLQTFTKWQFFGIDMQDLALTIAVSSFAQT